jgi:hypothetical protein
VLSQTKKSVVKKKTHGNNKQHKIAQWEEWWKKEYGSLIEGMLRSDGYAFTADYIKN